MRIERLEIKTKRLEQQLHFYREVLDQEIFNASPTGFELHLEYSELKFVLDKTATPYHIAFHIGAHQHEQALEWLKQRVTILKDGTNELVDFKSWNAKSIYFRDKDQNILELISRGHVYPVGETRFGGELIGIAEIGLATKDVLQTYTQIHTELGLVKFTGDSSKFCATGDDHGLLIIIDYNQKEWFPSKEEAFPSEFSVRLSSPKGKAELVFEGGGLNIREVNEG